jgi:hypothetical protein
MLEIFSLFIQIRESRVKLHDESRLNTGSFQLGADKGLGVFKCALNTICAFGAAQYLCDDEVTNELP